MAVQSPLTEPGEQFRLEVLAQGGIALAALETATNRFSSIHYGVARLPGALDLAKQIMYLRETQAALKSSLDRLAGLFEPVTPQEKHASSSSD
jgi:hypothetical protein